MTDLTYNITREDSAKYMWISTRTLDRKIKQWFFSFKKIANRVYMAREEVEDYKQKLESVYRNTPQSELIQKATVSTNNEMAVSQMSQLQETLKENFGKFVAIIREKDQKLQEKDRLIMWLQSRVVELENKLHNFEALPDYSKERQRLLNEKQELENKLRQSVPLILHNQERQKLTAEKTNLEIQLKSSVPANVYNQEKQQFVSEKQKLFEKLNTKETEINVIKQEFYISKEEQEAQAEQLKANIRAEKLWNIFYLLIMMVIVLFMFFKYFM